MAKHVGVSMDVDFKVCVVCGRTMLWRKAWAKNWAEVKFCSDKCRKHRTAPEREPLEQAILGLLANRAAVSTICPSEAARRVGGEHWQELMEPARAAARRLVDRGEVVITQKGRVIDPSTAKGPIRIRRKPSPLPEPERESKTMSTPIDPLPLPRVGEEVDWVKKHFAELCCDEPVASPRFRGTQAAADGALAGFATAICLCREFGRPRRARRGMWRSFVTSCCGRNTLATPMRA
jgi:hypothetical protein